MKKWGLMLGVSFLCFSSFATDYEFGSGTCIDFEVTEENYNNKKSTTNDKLGYAYCALIKGGEVGDEKLIKDGEKILKDLADEGNIVASYIYADFHYSNRNFGETVAKKNLKAVEMYFLKTFEEIQDSSYPSQDYVEIWEESHQIKGGVYSQLPIVYLQMYVYSLFGDFYYRLNPNFEETYSEYRVAEKNDEEESDTDYDYVELYIESAKHYAQACQSANIAEFFKESCAMEFTKLEELQKIQEDRKEVLENECSEDVSKESCSKIHVLNDEFLAKYLSIAEESNKIREEAGL